VTIRRLLLTVPTLLLCLGVLGVCGCKDSKSNNPTVKDSAGPPLKKQTPAGGGGHKTASD
jgi:hypothetical protein